MKLRPLPPGFYSAPTLQVARELIGKHLVRELDGEQLIGKIVETEAYIGEDDPACHAAPGKTPRNAVMYGPPGFSYVYFIYGMYYCLNAVTQAEGYPAAVLIWAVEPIAGIPLMQRLRNVSRVQNLANGPGKLCQAFAIDRSLNAADLTCPPLWIAGGQQLSPGALTTTTRIGIRVGRDKKWRYFLAGNAYISHPNHR